MLQDGSEYLIHYELSGFRRNNLVLFLNIKNFSKNIHKNKNLSYHTGLEQFVLWLTSIKVVIIKKEWTPVARIRVTSSSY